MSTGSGPPAYAWDWVARQRLVWREVRTRLAGLPDPHGSRYGRVSAKPDVLPRLRMDYPADPVVREVVQAAVADLVFLGRTDRPFAQLGLRNSPRGLRWWWRELTGEDVGAPLHSPDPATAPPAPRQLDLDEVLRGYGD